MLFKDFLFSFKNVHLSFFEKKKISKFIRVGISVLYKFFILELIIYNFFYKKDLDVISNRKKELFDKDLVFLFEHFNSLKKQHDYADFFQENLEKLRNNKLDILEIGTAKGDGLASLYFYFPHSNFIGIDNNPYRIRYKSKRIRSIYVDISSKKILQNLTNHLNQKFDLIIDDCSHRLIDQILCFSENFKNLKKDGIYIVEDLNFPEIHQMYNPTNEDVNLKTILKKINLREEIFTKFMNKDEIDYIQDNIDSIKFYKSKNKENYLIHDLCDYSEIAFIKKK
jgi:predicted O-methyltransferase YrrM